MNGGKGIYVGGTLVSILISLALYYTGKRESAIFVGLSAPTILNLVQTDPPGGRLRLLALTQTLTP